MEDHDDEDGSSVTKKSSTSSPPRRRNQHQQSNMKSSKGSSSSSNNNNLNTSQTNSSIIQYLNTYQVGSHYRGDDDDGTVDDNDAALSSDWDDQTFGLGTSSSLHHRLASPPLSHLNILLVGEKGAGKSSLLSTFHRALHQNYGLMPVAGVGNTRTMSFTKKKKGYYLNTCHTIKGYDTRGLESLLGEEIEQVRAIRDGRARDDVEITQKPYSSWTLWDHLYSIMSRNPAAILDPDCLNGNAKGEASIGDVPHCVVFVVPEIGRASCRERVL